jgi:hypothetical protein
MSWMTRGGVMGEERPTASLIAAGALAAAAAAVALRG